MRNAGAAAGKSCRQIVLAQHHEKSDPDTGGAYSIKKYTSEKAFDEDGSWHHEISFGREFCPALVRRAAETGANPSKL